MSSKLRVVMVLRGMWAGLTVSQREPVWEASNHLCTQRPQWEHAKGSAGSRSQLVHSRRIINKQWGERAQEASARAHSASSMLNRTLRARRELMSCWAPRLTARGGGEERSVSNEGCRQGRKGAHARRKGATSYERRTRGHTCLSGSSCAVVSCLSAARAADCCVPCGLASASTCVRTRAPDRHAHAQHAPCVHVRSALGHTQWHSAAWGLAAVPDPDSDNTRISLLYSCGSVGDTDSDSDMKRGQPVSKQELWAAPIAHIPHAAELLAGQMTTPCRKSARRLVDWRREEVRTTRWLSKATARKIETKTDSGTRVSNYTITSPGPCNGNGMES